MGRKRQRSRAALTDDDEVSLASEQDQDDQEPDDDDDDDDEREMELDVWEAFKEEHHQVLEQLPLSLHRQFKLMRELDAQSEAFHAELSTSVRRYVQLRDSLAPPPRSEGTADVEGGDPDAIPLDATPVDGGAHPTPFLPKPGETTRTLLQHIAQSSEEAVRTAEEKVNIAQTAYETVDRHIRLLDQAIKEQEAAISLGVRPGTHLAPILLPDLVVPRWARPPRVEHSPVPSLSPEPVLEPLPPSPKAPKKGKKAAAPRPQPEREETGPPAAVAAEEPAATRTRRTSVRLTMPAQPAVADPTVPGDPNEARYCYCDQVSFGTMIACDNKGCKREWFHLECTGLSAVPSKKTKWYCRDCTAKMPPKGRSRA